MLAFDGPGQGSARPEVGIRIALGLLERALGLVMKKPSARRTLRRNLWVHGVDDPMAFVALADESTDGDDLSAAAGTLAERLRCPTEYVVFGPDEDVSGHCEMSGRATFHRRVFDWLDHVLATRTTA